MQTGLLERKAELGRIDALLALAQAGSGDMLLITGPAGIGKSVLLGVARERARLAGMRLYHHHWLPGTAANWQNHHLRGAAAITVELPAGTLSPRQVRRHVGAVLRVARALRS